MNKDQQNSFSAELLRQDAAVSDNVIQELRVRLTQAVEIAECRANRVRRATFIACLVLVVTVLLEVVTIGLAQRFEMPSHWLTTLGGGMVFISLVIAGTLLSVYNDKYRPAVGERQTELQMAILTDLQHQISELKRAQTPESPATLTPAESPASAPIKNRPA
jgi:hypothetical protein